MTDLDLLARKDFIRAQVVADLQSGAVQQVVTRFPPEPNGYLHIGHAKAICVSFGVAEEFGGVCRLRFDDTNPATEEVEFVEAIQEDIRWLGFQWEGEPRFASDYFDQLVQWAKVLVHRGLAYVDFSDEETIRERRGTVSEAGTPTEGRDRPAEENLALFEKMLAGEFADGECVLRAKIDLSNPNMKMRDPLMYRVRHMAHHHAGDRWCVYPFYDWAHGQSDAVEGVSHSLCTLEFENNRELYDWFLRNAVPEPHPHQYEFARLTLTYFITSKRKMKQLVESGLVDGWDDPRMPTLAGQRRRGVPPRAIRNLVERVGLAKTNSVVDHGWYDEAIRDELNRTAPRRMAVVTPLKVVITNYEGDDEKLEIPEFPPELGRAGSRAVPFGRELFIDRDDFAEQPPKKWKRLAPGVEVRLRGAYFVRCEQVVRKGNRIVELRCTYDPESRGGGVGRKPNGTIHWVSARAAVPAEFRLYDRLFAAEMPGAERDFLLDLNPASLTVAHGVVEPSISREPGTVYQFERVGYFALDPDTEAKPIFNRTATLRDTWARAKKEPAPKREKKGDEAKTAPPNAKRPELSGEQAELSESLQARHGVSTEAARGLAVAPPLLALFLDGVAHTEQRQALANLLLNDLRAASKGEDALPLTGAQVAAVVELLESGQIGGRAVKPLLARLLRGGGEDPRALVDELGLAQITDPDTLRPLVQGVVDAHPDEVQRFRSGERKLQGFLLGQIMRASGGKADPKLAARVLGELLG